MAIVGVETYIIHENDACYHSERLIGLDNFSLTVEDKSKNYETVSTDRNISCVK